MYVPAEWTNVAAVKTKEADSYIDKLRSENISIGSVSDLLRMSVVIDALLNPPVCLDHAAKGSERKEELNGATEAATSGRKGRATANGVVRTPSRSASEPNSNARKSLSQVGRNDANTNKRRGAS